MELWFSEGIQKWYKKHKRDLPWRHEKDPYKIWISEIILQQTQVVQGLDYYYRFLERFPNIKSLAQAQEDEVMKLWQGLGYYSRARNLHAGAKMVVELYGGRFPQNYEQIKSIKGIGDYTAAAVSSFAFQLPYAVLDGNVYRLLSRLFGIQTPIDSGAAKKEFTALAQSLLDTKNPATHNQAIMEFGSQHCKVKPLCETCIFNTKCIARKEKMTERLPIKSKKTKVKVRHFYFFILIDKNNEVKIEKRTTKDIWQSLYQFPMIETTQNKNQAFILDAAQNAGYIKANDKILHVSKRLKHLLTHQTIYAHFFVIQLRTKHQRNNLVINSKKLTTVAFPRLIEKFLISFRLAEIN